MGWSDAQALLAGPRGRHLCWALLDPGDWPEWDQVRNAADAGDLTSVMDELAVCVARTDLDVTVTQADELALRPALVQSVDSARYWGEPDAEDLALAGPGVRDMLLPIAEAIIAAPAARWWSTPLASDYQQYVEWLDETDNSPHWTGTAAELAAWHSATAADERSARKLSKDPSAPYSGRWWSIPSPSRLPFTTRSLPGLGAVGLELVEDGFGWREARCWPAATRTAPRIYEISGPDQWADLAARYPLDVSNSRRHDWWKVTRRTGRWLIPDFTAVAEDYDAAHLSVEGYLATAGRALPVGDAGTLLAGWDPDQTCWLTDILAPAGPATTWVRSDAEPVGWLPASR